MPGCGCLVAPLLRLASCRVDFLSAKAGLAQIPSRREGLVVGIETSVLTLQDVAL